MNKTNLVVLKTAEPLFWEDQRFDLNKVYRCLSPVESGDEHNYMIYAEWFTQAEFDKYFEYAYDRVIRDWEQLNLVKDGKPVSFAEFKRRLDIHTYGKQIDNIRIGYLGISKENLYKFYPIADGNKQIQAKQMYEMFLYTLDENMYYLDNHSIQFGTFGVHISYVRK